MSDISPLDAIDKAFQGSGKSVFNDQTLAGTTVGGTITNVDFRQVIKYGTQDLDFFPSGDPKMQFVIQIQTDIHEDPDDDGIRAIYVNAWGHKKQELADAIRESGAKKASEILVPGTIITATFLGEERRQGKQGSFTQKNYKYTLRKGAPVGLDAALAPQQPAQPAYAPTAQQPAYMPPQQPATIPATPAPVAAPPAAAAPAADTLTKVQQLIGMGLDDDTISKAIGGAYSAQVIAAIRAKQQ